MQVEPHIILPSAALAVLLMIAFIRLIIGARSKRLTPENIREFLSFEEPATSIKEMAISTDAQYALVELSDGSPLRLIRSFGNKCVMQLLSPEDIFNKDQPIAGLKIKRQDIGHSGLLFQFSTESEPEYWLQKLIKSPSMESQT